MAKVKKRILGLALSGIISIGSLATVASELSLSKTVQAQEKAEYSQLRSKDGYTYYFKSEQGYTAYLKAKQIITSMQKNYAGIKNQVTWEGYIKEARALINKIPSKYGRDISEVKNTVDDLEHFIKYIAKMNHVEKSYATNYQGIKNAAQWEVYLEEALKERNSITWVDLALEVLDPKLKEVDNRYDVIEDKVYKIIDNHYIDLNKVGEKYNLALKNSDLALAKEALADANQLGTHETTTKLKNMINTLISYLS